MIMCFEKNGTCCFSLPCIYYVFSWIKIPIHTYLWTLWRPTKKILVLAQQVLLWNFLFIFGTNEKIHCKEKGNTNNRPGGEHLSPSPKMKSQTTNRLVTLINLSSWTLNPKHPTLARSLTRRVKGGHQCLSMSFLPWAAHLHKSLEARYQPDLN